MTKPKGTIADRGFASMSREKQREIASKGGRAAHARGKAHQWTPDEAREAGRRGGRVTQKDRAARAGLPLAEPVVPPTPSETLDHVRAIVATLPDAIYSGPDARVLCEGVARIRELLGVRVLDARADTPGRAQGV
jgi:general stress protein YciG